MLEIVTSFIGRRIRLQLLKIRWRKMNPHNFTNAGSEFPSKKVQVGNKTYGTLNIHTYGNPEENLTIGNFCSIAGNVQFLLGGEHTYHNLSTYPFKKYIRHEDSESAMKGPIHVQDDVWIGENCIILSGVTIHQGAVIAAGSVVVKDIPPYAIAGGNPAKVIKYRFPSDIVEKLLCFDFGKLTDQMINENIDLLYAGLDESFTQSKLYLNCITQDLT